MLKLEGINTFFKLALLAKKVEKAKGVSKFKLMNTGWSPTLLK
jgi:hypothetical protein